MTGFNRIQDLKERVFSIEKIKEDIAQKISSLPEHEKYAVLSENVQMMKELDKEYRVTRSEYDILYFTYEYFSDDRNPDNEDNLIPSGVSIEDAPDFHHELTAKLQELALIKPTKKVGWSVPRGHAKSMYNSNVMPIHSVVYSLRNYIVIISETVTGSRAFVEYVANQLKYNEKLREDFGEFLSPSKMLNEQDNLDGFVTHNNIKVQAASLGKQLRGARHGSERPDLIILDDLESKYNTNTKELRDNNLHWYNSVVVPLGTPEKTGIIYMGTLVHGSGLLPNILSRADYDSKIYSAIVNEPDRQDLWNRYEAILLDVEDADRLIKADNFYYENKEAMDLGAATLWQSRFPFKELVKIKVEVGSRAFSSEYLNKPSDPDSQVFNVEHFLFYDDKDLFDKYGKELPLEKFGFWDIAIGKNSRSDYNAIVTIGRDRRTGVMYVLDAWAEKVPLNKAADIAYDKIVNLNQKVFGVESVQAQFEMFRQLQQKCWSNGVYTTKLKPITPKGRKEDRIELLEPLIESGMLRFKKSQRLMIEMLEQFPNHDHDDLPDALAAVVNLAGNKVRRTFQQKPKGL